MAKLAKINKCTYSRYVDDITFSTSRKDFPSDLAIPLLGSTNNWELGTALREKIKHSGFKINDKKTRMQWKGSRQVTTGLLVNEKVNIRPEYYIKARSMCHNLFSHGTYYRIIPATAIGGTPEKKVITNLDLLQGILTHIAQVRGHSDLRKPVDKKAEPTAIRKLYRDFLFYKNFVALSAPLILSEGKTDPIYLKAAIRKLPAFQPSLGEMKADKFVYSIRFMNYSHTIHDVLQLGGGTGDFKHFIIKYGKTMERFRHAPLACPVVILIDNDEGAKEVFSVAKKPWGRKDFIVINRLLLSSRPEPLFSENAGVAYIKQILH